LELMNSPGEVSVQISDAVLCWPSISLPLIWVSLMRYRCWHLRSQIESRWLFNQFPGMRESNSVENGSFSLGICYNYPPLFRIFQCRLRIDL
jgi:hypothetical protein